MARSVVSLTIEARPTNKSATALLLAAYSSRSVTEIKYARIRSMESQRATLSDKTARKEYRVDQDFIVNGIRAGKLEYREGAIWGNPYLRLLRSQLEK